MVDKEDSASLPPADVQRPTPPLTDEELAEIEARAKAATPGPWKAWLEGRDHWGGDSFIQCGPDGERSPDLYLHPGELTEHFEADHDFIAHARADVPRLIADLRASRERVKELEAKLAWVDERIDSGEL